MQIKKCSLCLLNEPEVRSFLNELKKEHPNVKMETTTSLGVVEISFQGPAHLDFCIEAVQKRFPTFFFNEETIEEAVHKGFILRKKTLALAESCTGGALAAKLCAIPDASLYFLGSIVAYSNAWKERFLQVSRTTLEKKGAVSKEAVVEMVKGLLSETDADFAVAISGIAGPSGGSSEKPVGTIYVAIGQRGDKIDAGVIHAPKKRKEAIDTAVYLTLGALWRRLIHQTATFS